jgi:hypothetical protein
MSFEFRASPGDETIETLSSESPSESRLAGVLLCLSHIAYEPNSGLASPYDCVSDKLPSFILAELRFDNLKSFSWSRRRQRWQRE